MRPGRMNKRLIKMVGLTIVKASYQLGGLLSVA